MDKGSLRAGSSDDRSPDDVPEAPGDESKTKRLTLDIPKDLHRAIKLSAAADGLTMVEKLRTLLSRHYGVAQPEQLVQAKR